MRILLISISQNQQLVTLGGNSALEPPLPIPNRTVKRSSADDSVFSHVKVGHRQAIPSALSEDNNFL
jgi:hypothetical protein